MRSLVTAPIKEPVTVFLVGVQCRSFFSMWKIPLIGRRMMQMQKQLMADPNSGLIWGANFVQKKPFTTLFLSYWKSSDHIQKFVTSDHFSHKSSVKEYWQKYGRDPNIGVWHETYEIDSSKTENLYYGMAPFGVSAFTEVENITASNRTYLSRLGRS